MGRSLTNMMTAMLMLILILMLMLMLMKEDLRVGQDMNVQDNCMRALRKLLKSGTQRCRDSVKTDDSIFLSGCTERI